MLTEAVHLNKKVSDVGETVSFLLKSLVAKNQMDGRERATSGTRDQPGESPRSVFDFPQSPPKSASLSRPNVRSNSRVAARG
jgi:hypothetical protein